MKKTLYVLLGVVLLFVSCGKREMTAQQIFDEEKSGVVLIMNKYYYELTLPSGYQLFSRILVKMVYKILQIFAIRFFGIRAWLRVQVSL